MINTCHVEVLGFPLSVTVGLSPSRFACGVLCTVHGLVTQIWWSLPKVKSRMDAECSHSAFREFVWSLYLSTMLAPFGAQLLPQFSAWIAVFWAVPPRNGRADKVTLMVTGSPCGRLACGTRHDGGFSDATARSLMWSLYRFCSPLVWGLVYRPLVSASSFTSGMVRRLGPVRLP